MPLIIGIDDTDSRAGGCTTYVAYNIIKKLKYDFKILPIEYPHLVRLNPNVPYKTKGNGAVKITYSTIEEKEKVIERIIEIVREFSFLNDRDTDPTVVVHEGEIDKDLYDFYVEALVRVIPETRAIELVKRKGIEAIFVKEASSKGIVGALAAVGAKFIEDFTFELLVYRKKENWGKKREVDPESVKVMDAITYPFTFNNYDPYRKRVLITPHGPDPVLLGIRGETPEILLEALKYVKIMEEIEGWMIFKTNQGTDAHFTALNLFQENDIQPNQVVKVSGEVANLPIVMPGGHVKFNVNSKEYGEVEVVCFKESGRLNKIVRELRKGDKVNIWGGTRRFDNKICINLEKLEILELTEEKRIKPPICPKCKVRCESKGKRQGYVCKKCGYKSYVPEISIVKREIEKGIYLPDPASMRHLAKPFQRYNLRRNYEENGLIEEWLR